MTELITTELLKLQDELKTLGAAIEHIKKAEKISTSVVDVSKKIAESYPNHLQNIEELYKNNLEKNKDIVENNINELIVNQKVQAEELNRNLGTFIKQISYNENLSAKRLEATQDQAQAQIELLADAQQKQIDSINEILDGYVELAQSTAKLNDKIEKIDFPEQLSNISEQVADLEKKMNSIESQTITSTDQSTLELHKKLAIQNKRINTLLFLIVFVLLAVAALTIENFMDYVPDEQMKQMQDFFDN